MNPMTSRVFRAQMAAHIANARLATANALPPLMASELVTLSDQHREELDAIEDAHAKLIHASRLLAR
jgi:hypothetical protein